METTSHPKGFLDLPRELRDEIYEYLVVKPTNTITMLENHNCFQNEISAAQPAISRVNRQIRLESLPMFYKRNVFMAELSNFYDLSIAKNWLEAIGNFNATCLRRLALCGWTKVAFGHQKCRLWIRCQFDLKQGTLEVEGNEVTVDGSRHIFKDVEPCREAFRAMVEAREGVNFDVYGLSRLMEGFHGLCTQDCDGGEKDVDSSCRKCER